MTVRCILFLYLCGGPAVCSGSDAREDAWLEAPRRLPAGEAKLALFQTGVQLHAPSADPDEEEAAGVLQDVIEMPPELAAAVAAELGILPNVSDKNVSAESANASGDMPGLTRATAKSPPPLTAKKEKGSAEGHQIWSKYHGNNDSFEFPQTVDNMHIVASVAVVVHVSGINVHAYDLGLYVRSRCRSWGNFATSSDDHFQEIEDLLDNSLLYIRFSTKWVNRGVLAAMIDNLVPACEKHQKSHLEATMGSFTEALDEYKLKLRQGPQVGLGSTMLIWPRSSGVELKINQQDLGLVRHSALGSVTLHTYFDEDTLMPTFRQEVFQVLSKGYKQALRDNVGQVLGHEEVAASSKWPWWLMLIIVLLGLGLLVIIFWSVWRCCLPGKASVDKAVG
mmetsp:Transcript_102736/g.299680  ORF Transcript_102736/g.299680 Transcript_102736/m.299680 type:complete len:393 (-) Transcript_102736:46-1224(-)